MMPFFVLDRKVLTFVVNVVIIVLEILPNILLNQNLAVFDKQLAWYPEMSVAISHET